MHLPRQNGHLRGLETSYLLSQSSTRLKKRMRPGRITCIRGTVLDVYIECEAWMDDEPYSIRPYELSAGAANILDEHEKADEVTGEV